MSSSNTFFVCSVLFLYGYKARMLCQHSRRMHIGHSSLVLIAMNFTLELTIQNQAHTITNITIFLGEHADPPRRVVNPPNLS